MSGKRVMYVFVRFWWIIEVKESVYALSTPHCTAPISFFCKLADRRCVKRHLLKNILLISPIAFISSESELKEVKGEFTAGKTVF